jgi:hypothetical protein
MVSRAVDGMLLNGLESMSVVKATPMYWGNHKEGHRDGSNE